MAEERREDGYLYDETGLVPELDLGALAGRLIDEGHLRRDDVDQVFITMRLPGTEDPDD